MTPNRSAYLHASACLLMAMMQNELPVPLAVSWRYPHGPLHVQVNAPDFAHWLTLLADPTQDVDAQDDELGVHVHAEGQLRQHPHTRIHLITVTTTPLTVVPA